MDHSVESKSQSIVCDLDNLQATELRLGLPGNSAAEKPTLMASRGGKRSLSEAEESFRTNGSFSESGSVGSSQEEEEAPLAKAQVVGWPPVRSYRRNSFQARNAAEAEDARIYVKVSMDGAPYMRKIDLKVYKGYKELREAMEDMFKCFTSKEQIDERNGCEHAIIYEDKDGDWMLVGDVPWEMLISSCKRLRIMRGMEARGLVQSYEG